MSEREGSQRERTQSEPPSHPIFDDAPGRSTGTSTDPADWFGLATDAERKRLRDLERRIKERPDDRRPPYRPLLLVRAFPGDRGSRPLTRCFWESPDIWVQPGDPATTPAVPPVPGGLPVTEGQPHTLYAHVWNLGLAPVVGVTVEFGVFNPSLAFAGQTPLFRATTRTDLAGRGTPAGCHRLVKCPVPWRPARVNDGHECILVRVSAVGDPLPPAHEWDAWADRHLGQRNIGVLAAGSPVGGVLRALDVTLHPRFGARLVQVGAEAGDAVRLVRPDLRVDPRVTTHVLAELRPDRSLALPETVRVTGPTGAGAPAGAGEPVAPAGTERLETVRTAPFAVPRVAVETVLRLGPEPTAGAAFVEERAAVFAAGVPAAPAVATPAAVPVAAGGARLADLFGHLGRLDPPVREQATELPPPAAGDSQVLRVEAVEDGQLVGGYTIVVRPG